MAKYEYRRDDIFYDVESLENVFTVAWWYPHPERNYLILSYLDDDNIIKSQDDLNMITQHIYKMYPKMKEQGVQVFYEDLKTNGMIDAYGVAQPGMQTFAQRMGLAHIGNYLNQPTSERGKPDETNTVYHESYFPVKDTDPDYDPERHGFRFGYNSTNYDMTILAWLLTKLNYLTFTEQFANKEPMMAQEHRGYSTTLTANRIRKFNDELFSNEWIRKMPRRLAQEGVTKENAHFGNYSSPAWILRKAWLLTGRFIDVSKLNESLQKVGLKRLLGMLGVQIIESDKLVGNTTIHNLEEMADLLAYNISDVVNLQKLFEHKNYQNSFKVRESLLNTYPQTIYAQKKLAVGEQPPNGAEEAPCDVGNHLNIRKDRLARDSTSAKFVEFAIAPYKPIKDIPLVSFLYPSKQEAKKLGVPQTDVLEDTKAFFEKHVTDDPTKPAHKDFMEIYNFYDSMRGRNFNNSKAYVEAYGEDTYPVQPKDYVRNMMNKHNTNLFYHHKDQETGAIYRSSCLANFSIGGIHGAEVNVQAYSEDFSDYQNEKMVQDYVESQFTDALEAINGEVYIDYPEGYPVPSRLEKKIVEKDGKRQVKIREFMKSGSTRKKATWRDVKEVDLFKKNASGNYTIHPRYNYVSIGPSHHEDFTSYYPLLLSRLSVFINPSYHGYTKDGEPADPYYEMFLQRVAKKKEAKDKSLSQAMRELANMEQESRKLLINAASGAGDASFDNNIRANNAVISMRIIGQLFAWRIGQAQALAGARVPSTNTDGLYTMGITAEVNDQILEDIAKDMYISIEPERLDRFVSKDSNNRIEVYGGRITSARGGTLTSWQGPQPTQSLDHAAISDHIIAKYLADPELEDPVNTPFDQEHARKLVHEMISGHIKDGTPQEALKFFQWILSSSSGTHRYIYQKQTNLYTGKQSIRALQQYNRIFLVKRKGNTLNEMYLATRRSIPKATWSKRMKEYSNGDRDKSELYDDHDEALYILNENNLNLLSERNNPKSEYVRDEARRQKVRSMPNEQHTLIFNGSVNDLTNEEAVSLLQELDLEAYLEIIRGVFKSWTNLKDHK